MLPNYDRKRHSQIIDILLKPSLQTHTDDVSVSLIKDFILDDFFRLVLKNSRNCSPVQQKENNNLAKKTLKMCFHKIFLSILVNSTVRSNK